ncbi:unnamed protein product [Linum tenue]|uniref:BTB domain-containing protein n=1 Tax=Linum tenue TaxID=586396 RepID=A0AAV0MQY3_9ROSI|nr:unnamed protein product [Linum tenue]
MPIFLPRPSPIPHPPSQPITSLSRLIHRISFLFLSAPMDRRSTTTAKRILKRKLEQEFAAEDGRNRKVMVSESDNAVPQQDKRSEIESQVRVLNSTFSSSESDRAASRTAAQFLSQLAKNADFVETIVDCGAVPALVMQLQPPPDVSGDGAFDPVQLEVEKACSFALALIAIQPQYQQVIVDAGALPLLVALLKRHKSHINSGIVPLVIRKATDAITNLAHENSNIKTLVRIEGGIPPLVELLDSVEPKIVELNGLDTLVLMLESEDTKVHFEAVGAIGNLVHSSPHIKQKVLHAGALQPVINLLSSTCSESQREAALLIGQFATADSDCKVHIVQRGAISPLIDMLEASDVQLKEMSAFALGRLAQETHNQVGIVYHGGIEPLLKLLEAKNGSLQHNAAFTIFGLANNEDNIVDLIKVGAVQKLQDGDFMSEPTRECVSKTLKRIEENIDGRVLKRLLYSMRVVERTVQRQIAMALAHLCAPADRKAIFLDNNGSYFCLLLFVKLCSYSKFFKVWFSHSRATFITGLDFLLGLLDSGNLKHQNQGAAALYKLATKAPTILPVDTAPSSATPQVYLGEKFVNSSTLSDITFLVEGKRFYAHKICLLASSDTFRAMFDGGYKEGQAKDVEIPNITWEVFDLMMRFIYTGSVEVNIDVAHELLRAADQYLLDGLKRLCEYAIAQDISVDNITLMYELSENFNAMTLREACILYIFQHFEELSTKPWRSHLIKRILPDIRDYFARALAVDKPSPCFDAREMVD